MVRRPDVRAACCLMKKAQTPRKTFAPSIARVLKLPHYPIDVMFHRLPLAKTVEDFDALFRKRSVVSVERKRLTVATICPRKLNCPPKSWTLFWGFCEIQRENATGCD